VPRDDWGGIADASQEDLGASVDLSMFFADRSLLHVLFCVVLAGVTSACMTAVSETLLCITVHSCPVV
jgi:hypothetical protein